MSRTPSKKAAQSTYEMNICRVRTDVWHNNWMKFDACSRHSDGYLLEVKPDNTISSQRQSSRPYRGMTTHPS